MSELDAERMITEVMERYGDTILRTCVLFLHDLHAAEDAVQDTLIKAYKGFAAYRNRAHIKTWLMRIAINTCKDSLRRRRYELTDVCTLLESIPCYDDADNRLEADELISSITKLSEKYREVIILYYYQEMSTKAIAEVLSLPCSTVTTRLIRAREQLKETFKGWR